MPLPLKKVLEIINKHKELEKDLSSTDLDSKSFAKKSKEYSNLSEIIEYALEYSNFETDKKELEKIILDNNNEDEIKELAKSELEVLSNKHQKNENKLIAAKLKNKEDELINLSAYIVSKNELLNSILDDIDYQTSLLENKNDQKILEPLQKRIQSKIDDAADWDQFQMQFTSAHPLFMKNLNFLNYYIKIFIL